MHAHTPRDVKESVPLKLMLLNLLQFRQNYRLSAWTAPRFRMIFEMMESEMANQFLIALKCIVFVIIVKRQCSQFYHTRLSWA